MSADEKARIGQELATFFAEYQDQGFPEEFQGLDSFQAMSSGGKALLKTGNTGMIEKYVKLGAQTPNIFWPPGGV